MAIKFVQDALERILPKNILSNHPRVSQSVQRPKSSTGDRLSPTDLRFYLDPTGESLFIAKNKNKNKRTSSGRLSRGTGKRTGRLLRKAKSRRMRKSEKDRARYRENGKWIRGSRRGMQKKRKQKKEGSLGFVAFPVATNNQARERDRWRSEARKAPSTSAIE